MQIYYTVTLHYGDEGPDEGTPTPEGSDIERIVVEGLARGGFASPEGVSVSAERAQ